MSVWIIKTLLSLPKIIPFLLHEYIPWLKCMNYHNEELKLISSSTIPSVNAMWLCSLVTLIFFFFPIKKKKSYVV